MDDIVNAEIQNNWRREFVRQSRNPEGLATTIWQALSLMSWNDSIHGDRYWRRIYDRMQNGEII